MRDLPSPIAVLFRRLGPYHGARLQAVAARMDKAIAAIETSNIDSTYAWSALGPAQGFHCHTLFRGRVETPAPRNLWDALHAVLERLQPRVVAIPGWSDPLALGGLSWARRNRIPVILMSDSRADDKHKPHYWWKESVKAAVVRLADAALVAGESHASYLAALGMPPASILTGYDVVDNAHFAEGAKLARLKAAQWRRLLGLPERYFLTASRLVIRKGLPNLIRTYASYRQHEGADAWGLVLMGDGPLREELHALSVRLDVQQWVKFVGFQQYDKLPVFYGLASAFMNPSESDTWGLVVNEAMAAGLPVLVSRACGCSQELVLHGQNGWTFSPEDEIELAGLMSRISRLSEDERQRLSEAGQRRIADLSPAHFAEQFERAVCRAQAVIRRPRGYEQPLLWTLARCSGFRWTSER